jgi:DNA-binding LytR/AlgR family response regulator
MFYIAICDDEEYFCKREEQLIIKYMNNKGYKYKIEIFESGSEMLNLGNAISEFDMIFLDINMEETDGIETAREIRKITKDTYIVFVTAFVTYALEGYKVDAVRYLLKEDEYLEKSIYECLNTIIYKMNYGKYKHTFKFLEGDFTIYYEDILYIESNLHKLIFHMVTGDADQYTMYERLDIIDELLRNAGFCRIHKSYLVNLKYVESMDRDGIRLSGGDCLGISRSRYLDARNEFVCYRGEI